MAGLLLQLASPLSKSWEEVVLPYCEATPLTQANPDVAMPTKIAYSIAHAIPGRVRLRIPRITEEPEYVKRLKTLLHRESWLKSDRVNRLAASLIITYEPSKITDTEIRLHLALHGLLEAIAIARKAKQLIQQNTTIVAVPNLAALVVAVVFGLNPLAATVVNNGSTVVAGVNGLRPIL